MKHLILALLLTVSAASFAQTEVKLDAAAKKKLNTFFSNFSEAYVPSFTADSLSDDILINFGQRHSYINKYKSLKSSKDGLNKLVPSSLIDTATEKYCGVKVKSHKEKTYSVLEADGEAFTFSQIRSLVDNGDGTFTAKGEIFSGSSGFMGDPHGTPEEWAKADEDADCYQEFEALLKKSPSDKSRYVLLQYQIVAKTADVKGE